MSSRVRFKNKLNSEEIIDTNIVRADGREVVIYTLNGERFLVKGNGKFFLLKEAEMEDVKSSDSFRFKGKDSYGVETLIEVDYSRQKVLAMIMQANFILEFEGNEIERTEIEFI